MTHRQFVTWIAWINDQWEQPSRADYYAMQIAAEVRRVLHRSPSTVRLSDFKLRFKLNQGQQTPALTMKAKIALSKARMFAAVGIKPQTPTAIISPGRDVMRSDDGDRT